MSQVTAMRTAKYNGKPTFFWQGLLIILPVIALATMGIVFLSQDKALLVQQARDDSQRLSSEISRYISAHLQTQLEHDSIEAGYAHNQTNLDSRRQISSVSPGTHIVESRFHVPIEPHRELIESFLNTAVPPHLPGPVIASSGGLVSPGSYAEVPSPNSLIAETLSPVQRSFFSAMETNIEACEKLISETTTAQVKLRAKFALALLSKTNQPAKAEALLKEVGESNAFVESPSGLPVQVLAAFQLMQWRSESITHSNNPTTLSNLYASVSALATNTLKFPSFLTPVFLGEAARVAKQFNYDGYPIENFISQWQTDEASRGLYEYLTSQGLIGNEETKTSSAFWVRWQGEDRLVTIHPATGLENDENAYRVVVDSESLIECAVLELLDESLVRLPPYASVSFDVCNKRFPKEREAPQKFPLWVSGPWLDLGAAGYVDLLSKAKKVELATSYDFSFSEKTLPRITNATEVLAETFETFSLGQSKVPGLKVQIRLAQPEELFALQRKRVVTFGSLIAFAAVAALVGFVAAHRAFHRQLQLNELKSNFVSSVSHELRAPIASVRLMAEGLERGKISDPHKQKEYYRFIHQECRRLSSLIENVLDFARIEQGRKQYEFESTDVVKLTTETVRLMEPYAEEKQVTLQCCVRAEVAGVRMQAMLDGRAVQQALINLIDNAIKHSPNGAIVKVSLGAADTVFLWDVEDTGPGIPRDQHEKIFERFYRLGSELRRETQGIGIGLSLVRHIVEAHGGKIIVRSEPGQGSCFTIQLPMENKEEVNPRS